MADYGIKYGIFYFWNKLMADYGIKYGIFYFWNKLMAEAVGDARGVPN